MEKPIFLILIVTRNQENNNGVRSKGLFNEGGASDAKDSNDPRVSYKNTKYTYNLNHETPDNSEPEDEGL